MTNTHEIANVLLSEGISPSQPIYLATGLSKEELAEWREASTLPSATSSFFNVYTLVTREMVLDSSEEHLAQSQQGFWSAVSFLLGLDASVFIGNSASTFSQLLMERRQWKDRPSISYSGDHFRYWKPAAPARIFSYPIKWIFCAQPQKASAHALNMAKVALRSARSKTSLVPVGVTTVAPDSAFAVSLVSLGARLIYHTPSWGPHVRSVVKKLNNTAGRFKKKRRSHLLSDPEAMIGTFLRIDLPILGILDSFVLFADIDIIFQKDVTWEKLLGDVEATRKVPLKFAPPGQEGVPELFSMSAEIEQVNEPAEYNAGVMLLNMEGMRRVYRGFLDFILSSDDITWELGPGDQGAFKTFFRKENKPLASFLPTIFNWKAYWPPNPEAVLVHFHGPKCETDIVPYLETGVATFKLFRGLLKRCVEKGNCRALCEQYESYLTNWTLH